MVESQGLLSLHVVVIAMWMEAPKNGHGTDIHILNMQNILVPRHLHDAKHATPETVSRHSNMVPASILTWPTSAHSQTARFGGGPHLPLGIHCQIGGTHSPPAPFYTPCFSSSTNANLSHPQSVANRILAAVSVPPTSNSRSPLTSASAFTSEYCCWLARSHLLARPKL